MNDLTIVYAVAGGDNHYENLQRSIRSQERLGNKYKILIIDGSYKAQKYVEENKSVRIVYPEPHINVTNSQKHIFWKIRYTAYKYIDTEYALYLDSDTVFIHDTIESIIKKMQVLDVFFMIARHFWVPTFQDYIQKASGARYKKTIIDCWGIKETDYFVASGVFLWRNTKCDLLFNIVNNVYEHYYPNKNSIYIPHITDEVWLSIALNIWEETVGKDKVLLSDGYFNHCLEPPMPLFINNGVLVGRNPESTNDNPILIGHCDPLRRIPGWQYGGEVAEFCKKAFYL